MTSSFGGSFSIYAFREKISIFPCIFYFISVLILLMPELPEVETIRREITPEITGRCLSGITGTRPTVRFQDPGFRSAVRGRCITGTSRHGKYLFTGLDSGPVLVFHFGMTGDLQYLESDEPEPLYCRATISFRDGSRLAFTDPRRFGRILFAPDKASFLSGRKLGPDALSLTADTTLEIIRSFRRGVKVLLLDQHRLAGIGNIYADEVLFQARIHPLRKANDIVTMEGYGLHAAIRSVLETAVYLSADFDRYPEDWLIPHRACGESCPVCKRSVNRVMVAGRYAYFCPSCQQ
jgi:formamidopyrimidine-DNA glycosylase